MSSWFPIVQILGAVQGVFLAGILTSRRRVSLANRMLALTMLAFSLDLSVAAYHALGLERSFPHLIGVDFPLTLLYGPLLYLYARTLTRQESTLDLKSALHFLPFAIVVVILSPFYLQSSAAKLAVLRGDGSGLWTGFLGIFTHIKIVHALTYVGVTLVLLRRHRKRIGDQFSFHERVNLIWLRNLMAGIIALAVLAVGTYLLRLGAGGPVLGLDSATFYDEFTLLGTALFVYGIGFMGLRQPEIFDGRHHRLRDTGDASTAGHLSDLVHASNRDQATLLIPEPTGFSIVDSARSLADSDESSNADSSEQDKPRYAKSGMDPADAARYKDALLALMESDKPYRRGDLTLQDLSDRLGISPHNLTEVINTQLGQNFYDFVNGYRVREAQERLADPENANLTVLSIGLDAGFNSKSSFNAVFKKYVKLTPSQYRALNARV